MKEEKRGGEDPGRGDGQASGIMAGDREAEGSVQDAKQAGLQASCGPI